MLLRVFGFIVFQLVVVQAVAIPDIQELHAGNNVKVLYVAAPELPMVDIALTFNAGSEHDGEHPGLSLLMHSLLSSGTGDLDADAIASEFEDVGAQYAVDVDVDRSSVSLRSLTDPKLLGPALNTFIEIISRPSFPQRDFDRTKQQMLIGLREQEQNPSAIVEREFQQAVFNDHPYAQPLQGTPQSLKDLARRQLVVFHKKYLVQANVTLAIVGAVDRQQAQQIVTRILKALPAGLPAGSADHAQPISDETVLIPFPSQQAHVRIGQVGIERGNPDYFALYVGNHILGGGGFTSRLVEEVRSKRGLSYSVYSYFIPFKRPGTFILGLQTRADQVQQAIDVSQNVLKEFISHGPTEDELLLSKMNITGGFPLRIGSNRDILQYLMMIGYYDMPLDYLNTFNEKILAVSAQDIRKAFSRHVDPDQLVTVIVGGDKQES